MHIFKDPNSNRFNILSQFCPSVPSFKIFSSPLVFQLFNYSCYFYISLLNLTASSKFLMIKVRANGRTEIPTLLGQQCWELLGPCWQWCANGAATHNNVGTYSASWEGYISSEDLGDHM